MGNDPGDDVNRRQSFQACFIWFAKLNENARFRAMISAMFRAFSVMALAGTAHAVVVLSGASNTSAPAGQPYFDNMGAVGGATGIYLGNRWVLSAAHVAPSLPASATFGGMAYATQAGTFHRIGNPGGSGLSALTDIVLFRLASDPGLPSLSIAASAPTVGADVMMIGRGRTQENAMTYWEVTENPETNDDVWTERTPPDPLINASGFKTTEPRTMRWGENEVAAVSLTENYGFGDVRSFTTAFDDGAKIHEAQGIAGDSGGAVLYHNGSAWLLSGMMVAVSTFEKQPSYTAVLGNETLMADLSYYRSGILQIIPETGSTLLCLVGCLGLLLRRCR